MWLRDGSPHPAQGMLLRLQLLDQQVGLASCLSITTQRRHASLSNTW
jgi:hypothetical protein